VNLALPNISVLGVKMDGLVTLCSRSRMIVQKCIY